MSIVLPLLYLPPLSYWAVLAAVDTVQIELYENYPKGTYRNRALIAGPNSLISLSVPLVGGRDSHRLYRDAQIDYTTPWQQIHWRSMVSSYASAPYYEHYMEHIQAGYASRVDTLMAFNLKLFHALIKLLKLKTTISYTDEYEIPSRETCDLRAMFKCSHTLTQYTIADKMYIIQPPIYTQVFTSPDIDLGHISIVDLLFNEGPHAIELLRAMVVAR
jgi:hypothetical protein